jgi:hypothetical protein
VAILTTVLLALHLLAVDVAAGVPLVCLWLAARRRHGNARADEAGRRLAWTSLFALLVGIGFGALLVGMAWLDPQGGTWQAARRFPASAYGFAGSEVVFSLVCLWIYARMWDPWRARPWFHGLMAVAGATNLLYHFPPLMIVLGELSARPTFVADTTITHAVFRHLTVRPDVLWQVVHFAVAAVAVSGWALMGVAYQGRKSGVKSREPEQCGPTFDSLISAGAWIALAASLVQLGVGVLVLVEMPIGMRNLLLGGDWLSAALFLTALVAAFTLFHTLAIVALGDTGDVSIRRSGLLMILVIVLMAGSQVRARRVTAAGGVRLVARVSASDQL